MREETSQEKSFHDLLPSDMSAHVHVTFGYQDNLRIIQDHLQTFYGSRVDWARCIELFLQNRANENPGHVVRQLDDIPIITADRICAMIKEEESYQTDVKRFLQLNQKIKDAGESANTEDIFRAAALLGIAPNQETDGLFSRLIDRKGLSGKEKKDIRDKISNDIRLYALIVDLFSTLFVPGMRLTFPNIGTAMTQQKSKYYYRGENAFYGSSKPGMFRSTAPISPIQKLASILIMDEACFFLDNFDAVRKWNPSGVNYHALAQHYGIKTSLLDITSDLKTALFFACCTYENHQWRPMKAEDFVATPKKFKGKDSRYGVIYQSPTEITDMKWALMNDETASELITPIGYQPFMRCSAQHGYMLSARDETYDLLQDPLFDKFRFEHDEDFCKWIFEEMDNGAKVYPHEDIPKIDRYMEEIRDSSVISQETFEHIMEQGHYSEQEARAIKQRLQSEGYTVLKGQTEYIHHNKLRKINKQYSIDVAYSKVDITPVARPMIILPADTPVEQTDDGVVVLSANYGKDTGAV